MSKQLLKIRQPEPKTILVEEIPVKEGTKFSNSLSWENIRGLTWMLMEEEY